MKPIKRILVSCLLLAANWAAAHSPQAFNYQAVARGTDGKILVNKTISVRTERPIKLIDTLRKLRHNIN